MLRPNRIGQGLSVQVIIIAGLALIVLVVLSVMIAQKSKQFGEGTREVSDQRCEPPNEVYSLGTRCELLPGAYADVGPNEICCRRGTAQ